MLKVNYNILDIIKEIEKATKQKARQDISKKHYIISNVTEKQLLNLGFEFIGVGQWDKYPMYQLGNILALFKEQLLVVSETII